MVDHRASPPNEATKRWLERMCGGVPRRFRGLGGGSSADVWEFSIDAGAKLARFVVKQPRPVVALQHPDLVARAVVALDAASAVDVGTPEIVAVDEDGSETEIPTIVTRRIPGRVELAPSDLGRWLRRFADSLVAVHEAPSSSLTALPRYAPFHEIEWVVRPSWIDERAFARLRSRATESLAVDAPEVLVHRDFQPYNVLWSRGAIVGVVDWVETCRGPGGADVGHATWNLAALFGADAAFDFVHRYERASETVVDQGWLAVGALDAIELPLGIPGQAASAGRADVTTDSVVRRLSDYVERLSAGGRQSRA